GDAEGEIAARLDQAAGGAHLAVARQEPGIADDAAAALRRAEGGCYLVEGLPVADAIAGTDDEIRLGQGHGVGIDPFEPLIDDLRCRALAVDGGKRAPLPAGAGDRLRRLGGEQDDAWRAPQEIAGATIAAARDLLRGDPQHPRGRHLPQQAGDAAPD